MNPEAIKVHEQQELPKNSPDHKKGPESTKEARDKVDQANERLKAVVEGGKKSGEKPQNNKENGLNNKEKGSEKSSEKTEKISEQAKKDLEVFREVGNVTAVEMGEKINKKMAEISEKKGNVTEEDYQKARQEVLDSMSDEELQKIMQARIDKLNSNVTGKNDEKLTSTLYEALRKKDPFLARSLDSLNDEEFSKKTLATYGPEKIKAIGPILEQLNKDGKDIPTNLEDLNKLLKSKWVEKAINEAMEHNSGEVNSEEIKQKAENIFDLTIKNGSANDVATGLGTFGEGRPFRTPDYSGQEINPRYKIGEKLSEETMGKLKEIYNSNSSADKRILDTIDRLSDNNGFKNNVAQFLITAKEKLGRKIYQANGDLGGFRSLDQQRNIMKGGGTKVKDPSRSYHTKGEAIDLNIKKGDLEVVRLAAQHGLWNGAEMWDGWDHVHFQSEYSGNRSKKARRLAKMKQRGTLPVQTTTPGESAKKVA